LAHHRALADLSLRLSRWRGSGGLSRRGFACGGGPNVSAGDTPPLGFGEDIGGRRRDRFLGGKLGFRVEGVVALPPGERGEDGFLSLAPVAVGVKKVSEQEEQRVRLTAISDLKCTGSALGLLRLQQGEQWCLVQRTPVVEKPRLLLDGTHQKPPTAPRFPPNASTGQIRYPNSQRRAVAQPRREPG